MLPEREFAEWRERTSLESPVKLLHDSPCRRTVKAQAVTLLEE